MKPQTEKETEPMTRTISTKTTLGQLVAEDPARAGILEILGLDYYCGGSKTLAEACREKGLDPEKVRRTLGNGNGRGSTTHPAPADMSLTELAEHIVAVHHAYLHETLPALTSMAEKVARTHGDRDERLHEVEQVIREMTHELKSHLLKEERVLFPAISRLDAGQPLQGFACGALSSPISVMEMEHRQAGQTIKQLRALTDDYAVPEWACNTYKGLIRELERLEWDTYQHIHKEDNILFPKTLKKESACSR